MRGGGGGGQKLPSFAPTSPYSLYVSVLLHSHRGKAQAQQGGIRPMQQISAAMSNVVIGMTSHGNGLFLLANLSTPTA